MSQRQVIWRLDKHRVGNGSFSVSTLSAEIVTTSVELTIKALNNQVVLDDSRVRLRNLPLNDGRAAFAGHGYCSHRYWFRSYAYKKSVRC